MAAADVLKKIKQENVKFVDLRFTDTKGKEQHVSVPTSAFDKTKFTEGHAFDGSSNRYLTRHHQIMVLVENPCEMVLANRVPLSPMSLYEHKLSLWGTWAWEAGEWLGGNWGQGG